MKKIYDIENSIEELKKWVEKNPTIPVSSQVKDEFFEDKSKLKEEYEKMRKLYGYLRVERSRKHMTDEQIDRCKEANIGGVFGYSKKYEDIAKAWRCSTESLLEILKQYGTIEKFYNAYVKNEIDTYKLPKYIEIERIFPRVHDMEMNNDINYNRLASAIDRANSRGELYYYSKSHLEKAITTLTEREMKVIKLRFGLEDGKFRNLEEVGKEFNVTRERIRQIEAKALRKLRHPSRNVLTKLDLEQLTEEEVKEILEANKKLSITDTPIEEKEKSNEIIKKYIQRQNENVYKLSEEEQKTIQENKTVKQVIPSNKFEDMAIKNLIHDKNITMSVRLYNCLRHSTLCTEKVKDLLKMNIKEIRKIGSLGRKTEEELVNILDKKGYVLDKNGNFVKKEEPVKKNNEEIQMVYKTPEIIKKGIEALRKENEEKQQQIELVDELMALFDEQEELKAKNSQLDEEIKRKLAILEGKGFTITYGKK